MIENTKIDDDCRYFFNKKALKYKYCDFGRCKFWSEYKEGKEIHYLNSMGESFPNTKVITTETTVSARNEKPFEINGKTGETGEVIKPFYIENIEERGWASKKKREDFELRKQLVQDNLK